ncbi:MAG TPA: hypothetical protein VLE53_18160 [Gemmatimonadaceae bacterium]|nr:hypothetical protein [Gemmatimonadaceae bacterium]
MTAIDWKTELRKIEREIEGLPPEPSPAQVRAQRAAEAREKQAKHDRAARRGAWARLTLVVALGGAIAFWPYARSCGVGLLAFMSAGAMVLLGGIWVAACTWRLRMGVTHALAIGLTVWGLVLVGHQVLPRVGYPGPPLADASAWFCGR